MSTEYQAMRRNLNHDVVTLTANLKKSQVFLVSTRSSPNNQPSIVWNYLQIRQEGNPIISENQQIYVNTNQMQGHAMPEGT